MFLTQILNGKVTELALCESCARAKGLFDPQTLAFAEKFFPEEFKKRIDRIVRSLTEEADLLPLSDDLVNTGEDKLTQCSACHFTLEDFRRTNRLGCPACYEAFASEIFSDEYQDKDLTQETGNEQKTPAMLRQELERELKEAISEENYEKAAELRDRLQELKGQ